MNESCGIAHRENMGHLKARRHFSSVVVLGSQVSFDLLWIQPQIGEANGAARLLTDHFAEIAAKVRAFIIGSLNAE